MGYPTITRKMYAEFVELIKRAEYDSLESYSFPGKKVQIWLKSNGRGRDQMELEYCTRPKKMPYEKEDGTFPAIELYRVGPHNLKKLYSKVKPWKDNIDWEDACFGDTDAYAELVEYHIHTKRSKLNIEGIIKEVYAKRLINGIDDDPEMYWTDNDDKSLSYEDELVDYKGKSANDYNHEGDDEDEW